MYCLKLTDSYGFKTVDETFLDKHYNRTLRQCSLGCYFVGIWRGESVRGKAGNIHEI